MASPRAENCFICSEPQRTQLARPNTCPNHYFHRACLVRLAQKRAKCPIDGKEFQRIIGDDGTAISVGSAATASAATAYSSPASNAYSSPASNDYSSSASNAQVPDELRLLEAALRAAAVSSYTSTTNFNCGICHRGGGGERAQPNACNHEFHRECLMTYTDTNNLCPQQGCNSEIRVIHCQNGDLVRIVNPLKAMLSAAAAGGSFRCQLCGEDDAERERALTKPCGHEFHKGCLIERCRRNNKCPQCGKRVTGLNCMLSEDLNVGNDNKSCRVM